MFRVEEVEITLSDDELSDSDLSKTVATGETAEACLINLIDAINREQVDVENCFLRLVEGAL